MEATNNLARFPELKVDGPVTTQTSAMSPALRIEVVTNVIAGVLHDAYAMQHGLVRTQLAHCQPAVQQVYEGLARLAVLPLLDDGAVKAAEADAVGHGLTILGDYMDEDDDDGIPANVWQHRISTAIRAALTTYTSRLMAVPR